MPRKRLFPSPKSPKRSPLVALLSYKGFYLSVVSRRGMKGAGYSDHWHEVRNPSLLRVAARLRAKGVKKLSISLGRPSEGVLPKGVPFGGGLLLQGVSRGASKKG